MLLPASLDFNWLELFTVPRHAVILGAGVVLLVFTSILNILDNMTCGWRRDSNFHPLSFVVLKLGSLKAIFQNCIAFRFVATFFFDELFDLILLGQLHLRTIESQELVHVGVVGP